MRARIAVRENKSGNKLGVEVLHALSLHAAIEASSPEAGVLECEIEYDVVEPRDPLEVTFSVIEGAIEGEFNLVSLQFHRRS